MRLYIDVGHGETGTDSGASAISGPTKYYENERNLRIARACAAKLREHGHTVTMSREQNVNLERVDNYNAIDSNIIRSASYANNGDFDAMISIHCNDYSDSKARGYVLVNKNDAESNKMADCIAICFDEAYKGKKIPCNDMRDDYTRYGILRLHNKPGVLVECGFMSNASDLHEILCNYNLIGEAIADGILQYIDTKSEYDIDNMLYKLREKIDIAIDDLFSDIKDMIWEARNG